MPPTGNPPIWTINASGITPPGSNGVDLVGCHITQNSSQSSYEFTAPNVTNILATTPGSSLPSLPFTFPQFSYDGLNWLVTVNSLPVGATGSGTWNNPLMMGKAKDPTAPSSGDFTAQSGSGVGDDEGAGHSAKAHGGSSK